MYFFEQSIVAIKPCNKIWNVNLVVVVMMMMIMLWNFCFAFGWLVGWPGADCCRFLVRASDCIVACHVVILMMHLLSFKKVIYVVDNWILTLCCMEWMSFHG